MTIRDPRPDIMAMLLDEAAAAAITALLFVTGIFNGSTGIGRRLIWSHIGAVDLHSAPGERVAEGVFQRHRQTGGLGLVC